MAPPRIPAIPLAIAILLVFSSRPVVADFLQLGYDAARHGYSPSTGPKWDDVAWTVSLPGSRVYAESPILIGRTVYVLTDTAGRDFGMGSRYSTDGVFAIDLDRPSPRLFLNFSAPPRGWTSDGDHFFVMFDDGLSAYDAESGSKLWHWTAPSFGDQGIAQQTPSTGSPAPESCPGPAFDNGTIFLACVWGAGGTLDEDRVFAAGISAVDGRQEWLWVRTAADEAARAPVPFGSTVPASTSVVEARTSPPTVLGPIVVIPIIDVSSPSGAQQIGLWALQRSTGQFLWERNSTESPDQITGRATSAAETQSTGPLGASPAVAMATGSTTAAFVRFWNLLLAVNVVQGNTIWQIRIGNEDASTSAIGSGVLLDGDELFATSHDSLYRLPLSGPSSTASAMYTLPRGSGEAWGTNSVVAADGILYARSTVFDTVAESVNTSVINAIQMSDGQLLWRHAFPTEPISAFMGAHGTTAVGDGVLIVALSNGNVTALGETNASPAPVVAQANNYPEVGSPVTVNLSGSRSGFFGAPVLYRADWGDGNVSAWGPNPTLAHVYRLPGDRQAFFYVANGANQTARSPYVFHVGSQPPQAPAQLTLVQEAFSPEWQNTTFFVLGLIVSVVGATLGIWRVRRNRRTLARELAALDSIERMRFQGGAVQSAALSERRAVARALVLHGRLSEAQFVILERRIEEVAKATESSAIR